MFNQTFNFYDLATVGLLVILEGVLSIDNALVLGLLAKRVPKHLQKRALTYGLIGAFVFRLIAIATAQYLLKWRWVKLAGGAYLVYVAVKHFLFEKKHELPLAMPDAADAVDVLKTPASTHSGIFWRTVVAIELTDIAFAIDSILAAIALVGQPELVNGQIPSPHPKLWVVVTGGFLGVILMRFAAVLFIKLLDKFPRFEMSAYLLVMVIGLKLAVDWHFNRDPHDPKINFHSPSDPVFWVFWITMMVCLAVGFLPQKQVQKEA